MEYNSWKGASKFFGVNVRIKLVSAVVGITGGCPDGSSEQRRIDSLSRRTKMSFSSLWLWSWSWCMLWRFVIMCVSDGGVLVRMMRTTPLFWCGSACHYICRREKNEKSLVWQAIVGWVAWKLVCIQASVMDRAGRRLVDSCGSIADLGAIKNTYRMFGPSITTCRSLEGIRRFILPIRQEQQRGSSLFVKPK